MAFTDRSLIVLALRCLAQPFAPTNPADRLAMLQRVFPEVPEGLLRQAVDAYGTGSRDTDLTPPKGQRE